MIYKSVKRNDFFYSSHLEGYVYKNKLLDIVDAQKLRYKWAKSELIVNAKRDPDYTPLKLELLKVLIANLAQADLIAKQPSLTYLSLKRYVEAIFKHHNLTLRKEPLLKTKRPYAVPELDGALCIKGFSRQVEAPKSNYAVYGGFEVVKVALSELTITELADLAIRDEMLSNCANQVGIPLFIELAYAAFENGDLRNRILDIYDFIKHLIVTVERYFDVKLKPELRIAVCYNPLTQETRFQYNFKECASLINS